MIRRGAWNDFDFFFFNLLMLDLWPSMWSILENVSCALEKNVKFIALAWNVLLISIRPNWSIVSLKVCVSLIIFCLTDLSIGVSEVLKSPTIIVLLLISPFILLNISSRIEVLLCWMHIYYDCYMFFLDWSFDHYVAAIFVSCHALYFKVYFTWYECCYS